jgi:hypothetical protein
VHILLAVLLPLDILDAPFEEARPELADEGDDDNKEGQFDEQLWS